MSRHLDSSTTTQTAKINLYGHPLAGLLWKMQFEKILLKYVWEKVSNWECFSLTEKKVILICVCG